MPRVFPSKALAPWPRRTATPARPMAIPRIFRATSFSSPNAARMTTANNGVVAFNTEARPLAICVCPVTMSENGMTLLRIAIMMKGVQLFKSGGSLPCSSQWTGTRIAAARATRARTIVSGGNCFTTTPAKKYDPPHRMESRMSKSQSRGSIIFSLAVMGRAIGRSRVARVDPFLVF